MRPLRRDLGNVVVVAAPISPGPTGPTPIDPVSITSVSIDPASINAAPINAASIDPASIAPSVDAAPITPTPVAPAPVDPTPIDPGRTDPTPVGPAPAGPRSARGEQTRAAIVTAALELFRERGYEKTTMRAVADAAGVSLGNAYYYVASKEHLVQAFYDRLQEQHAAAAAPVLDATTAFAARLAGVERAFLELAEPYHEFAGLFFRNAADPASPLSPFSPQSGPARAASTALYREVVTGSDVTAPPAVLAQLPDTLWLMHMGVVLFWVHDTSTRRSRSHRLVRQAAPIVDTLVRLTRLPGVRGIADDVVGLIRSLSR